MERLTNGEVGKIVAVTRRTRRQRERSRQLSPVERAGWACTLDQHHSRNRSRRMTSDSLYIIFPRSSSTNVHVRGCLRNVDSRTTTEVDLEEEDAKRTKKRKKKNSRHFFVARVDIACLYSSLRYISIDCFKKEVEKFFFSKRNGKLIKLRHGVRGVAD